jgi:hypothetical protein
MLERPLRQWPSYLRQRLAIVSDMVATRDVFRGDRLDLHDQMVRRANQQAASGYNPQPYPGRVMIILTSRSVSEEQDPRYSWDRLARGGSVVVRVPGMDSGALLVPPFVSDLASVISQALDDPKSEDPPITPRNSPDRSQRTERARHATPSAGQPASA